MGHISHPRNQTSAEPHDKRVDVHDSKNLNSFKSLNNLPSPPTHTSTKVRTPKTTNKTSQKANNIAADATTGCAVEDYDMKVLHDLPKKEKKKVNYVVVEEKLENLNNGRRFLNWHGKSSVTSLLPPVERNDGVFKEKIIKESMFHNSERRRKKLPVQERSMSFTLKKKAGEFVHDWIPGITTPDGIVLVSGLAILVGVQQGPDFIEKFSTAASSIVVSAVTLGLPAAALNFL